MGFGDLTVLMSWGRAEVVVASALRHVYLANDENANAEFRRMNNELIVVEGRHWCEACWDLGAERGRWAASLTGQM